MSDLVSRALDKISATLMIDDEWMVRGERELTWTAHRLGQTFSVNGPYDSHGFQVCRVSSIVPVVAGPQAEKLAEILSIQNSLSVADALVSHPTDGLVASHLAAVFHDQTFDWRLSQFISLAIIQLVLSEAQADFLPGLVGGHPAHWTHPRNGRRLVPDDMLNVVEAIFKPAGMEPSRFRSNEDFKAVETSLEDTRFYTMGSSEEGIAIEVPFGTNDTSLIRLHADQIHPELGSGLLATLQIRPPAGASNRSVAGLAADMNWQECSAESMHQYGAWHARNELLTHAHFLPNAEFRQGITFLAAQGQIQRAIWADLILNRSEDLEPGDAASIVYERLFGPGPERKTFDA